MPIRWICMCIVVYMCQLCDKKPPHVCMCITTYVVLLQGTIAIRSLDIEIHSTLVVKHYHVVKRRVLVCIGYWCLIWCKGNSTQLCFIFRLIRLLQSSDEITIVSVMTITFQSNTWYLSSMQWSWWRLLWMSLMIHLAHNQRTHEEITLLWFSTEVLKSHSWTMTSRLVCLRFSRVAISNVWWHTFMIRHQCTHCGLFWRYQESDAATRV